MFNISISITYKLGKEQIEFATKECERLYKLIEAQSDNVWAIGRLERLQEMVLHPDLQATAKEVSDKISRIVNAREIDEKAS